MAEPPAALRAVVERFANADRELRTELLLSYSGRFRDAPSKNVHDPDPASHRVPGCESEVDAWAVARPDGRFDFRFAVASPMGVSARALACILSETLSGADLDDVLAVDEGIVTAIFGPELSMGKGQGLTGMVAMVKALARLHRDTRPPLHSPDLP